MGSGCLVNPREIKRGVITEYHSCFICCSEIVPRESGMFLEVSLCDVRGNVLTWFILLNFSSLLLIS